MKNNNKKNIRFSNKKILTRQNSRGILDLRISANKKY